MGDGLAAGDLCVGGGRLLQVAGVQQLAGHPQAVAHARPEAAITVRLVVRTPSSERLRV